MVPSTIVGAINLASQLKTAVQGQHAAGQAAVGAVTGSTAFGMLQNRSLIDVSAPARVEPIAMIDADCINLEQLPDLMQSLHSMFSGYYLQAVNMFNTVDGVTVGQMLSRFNPNAGASLGFESLRADSSRAHSMEEYRFKLPMVKDMEEAATKRVSMENVKVGTDPMSVIRDASNLAVGKMFHVQLAGGEKPVTMPVSIRLMAHSVPSRTMVELFSNTNAFDNEMGERYHSWKAGRLAFVKDLILCNDLIDKRIRSGITDPDGVLATIRNRQSGNNTAAVINGAASVANATNLAVLSRTTLSGVEAAQGGPFSNSRVRRAVFDSTNLMIVAVVDKEWDQVEFFFRNLDASTKMGFRELKSANKNDGGQVVDIMKAYMAGSAPRL